MPVDAGESRAVALPESVRHSLMLQEEIAKMSDRSEGEKLQEEQACSGGSLERWQGPYWWKSLKNGGKTQPAPRR